jgi:hypothetical protein
VVGDVSRDEMRSRVLARIETWPSGKIPGEHFITGFADQKKTIKIDAPSQALSFSVTESECVPVLSLTVMNPSWRRRIFFPIG